MTPVATDGRIELLANVPLFSSLSRRELTAIGRACRETSCPSGREIVREGSPAHQLYVIVSGQAMARRDGRRTAMLGPGRCFGELAIVDRAPSPSTIVADSDVSLLVLARRQFKAVLDQVPAVGAKLVVALARRLREADRRSAVL